MKEYELLYMGNKIETTKIGRYTIVKVKETINNQTISGIGISRCSDEDNFKKDIAEKIALGRAVNALEMKKKGKQIHNVLMG